MSEPIEITVKLYPPPNGMELFRAECEQFGASGEGTYLPNALEQLGWDIRVKLSNKEDEIKKLEEFLKWIDSSGPQFFMSKIDDLIAEFDPYKELI